MNRDSSGRSTWDGIALLGFLILAVIVIWGAVHAARLAAPYFASFFPEKTPAKITIVAPSSVISGTPFTIEWNYKPEGEGKYILLHQCRSGLTFTTSEKVAVPCGAAFPITTSGSITLVPGFTGESEIQVPMSIVFVPAKQGAKRAQGGATLTVNPSRDAVAEPVTPSATTPTKKPTTPSTSSGQAGKPDLSVQILAVGVIHPITGQFLNVAPANASDMVAVQFDIGNVGQSSTGTWYFEASLPTEGGYMYYSPAQAPLQPGDHVVNTLRFTNSAAGGGIVSIQLDPANQIAEMSEGDNYASQHIYVPYYASPYVY